MSAIFISYRRDDAEGHAGRLFEDLVDRFGSQSVFMDVAGIDPGLDFRKVIDTKVAECGVLLAMIGKNWLDATDESGARRIDNPRDFVRLETGSALRRDIPVIPVLVQGASMPRAEQLPDDMADLAFRNAVELTHARWPSDVQVLIGALERLNVGVPGPGTSSAESAPAGSSRGSVRPAASQPPEPVPVASAATTATRPPAGSGLPRSALLGGAALLAVLAFGVYLLQSDGGAEFEETPATAPAVGGTEGIDAAADSDIASQHPRGLDLSGLDLRAADFAASADGPVTGSFRQTGNGVWREYDKDGEAIFTFRESSRSDASVELWDDSRNVGIQLDLDELLVNYKEGPNAPYRILYSLVELY